MQYSTCQDNALGNIVKNEERRVCTKVNWKKVHSALQVPLAISKGVKWEKVVREVPGT